MTKGIIDIAVRFTPLRAAIVLIDRGAIITMRLWSSFRLKALVRGASGPNFCHWTTEIKYPSNIQLGHHVAIGPNCTLGAMSTIRIGNYVRISKGAVIETAGLNLTTEPPYKHHAKPITIEDGAWIGSNAIVLGGVTIGKNAIVGAGTVVTKDLPPNTVLVGSPTRLIPGKS